MSVVVGRPVNGISLNGLEFLLDDEDEVIYFSSVDEAKKYLDDAGIEPEEYSEYTFLESGGTCRKCGSPLFPSIVSGYESQCFCCDEDFYHFEQPSFKPPKNEGIGDNYTEDSI